MGAARSIFDSDNVHNLLVSGFLRSIHHENTTYIDFDESRSKLYHLCLNFYHNPIHQRLIIWSGTKHSGNKQCNGVSLINITRSGSNKKQHKLYKFNIHNLDNNNFCDVEWNGNFDRVHSSYSLLYNINISEIQWIINKYPSTFNVSQRNVTKKRYDIIVRIGSDHYEESRINILLFDQTAHRSRLIEAYYTSEVDTFPKMPFISCTDITNNDKGIIFGYGGKQRGGTIWNNIYSVDINTLKYRRYSKLSQAKYGATLTVTDNHDLFILGGNHKTCDVLKARIIEYKGWMNADSNLCTNISDLNMNRLYGGSSYFHNDNNKIIVGGGCSNLEDDCDSVSSHSMEVYDINKNKWSILQCKTNKAHCKYPLIWNDVIYGNVIYVGGNKTRNDLVKNLGYIEWCDIRENKKKFNILFNNEPVNHLFKLTKKNNTDKINWLSRALLI